MVRIANFEHISLQISYFNFLSIIVICLLELLALSFCPINSIIGSLTFSLFY